MSVFNQFFNNNSLIIIKSITSTANGLLSSSLSRCIQRSQQRGLHLRRHLATLEQTPALARAYRAVLDATQPLQLGSEQTFKLHSLGLVHLQGNGVVPSFELYRRYFSDRLHIVDDV